MDLEWSENGEWCQRLGRRGALVWKAMIAWDHLRRDGSGNLPWAIQYESRWSGVMGWIPLGTSDRELAKRVLRSWATDFDRNEIETLLERDAAKRRRRKE